MWSTTTPRQITSTVFAICLANCHQYTTKRPHKAITVTEIGKVSPTSSRVLTQALNRLKKIDLDVKKALTIYFQIRKFGCFDRMGMTFSVIVPTYNRLNLLKNTLESLYRQDYADFEIIVVNDGSTDGTDEFLASLAMQNKISYLKHPNQGLAATRTAGLGVAAGEYIAFTDDDCVVPVTWLRTLKEAFQQETVAGIGGATHTGDRKNPSAEANDMINNFFKRKLNTGGSRCPYFTGNNMAFKKSSLLRVGGP